MASEVLASESWHKGSSTHCVTSPMVDKERMRPGYSLGLMLCVSSSALILMVELSDRKEIRLVSYKPHSTYLQ